MALILMRPSATENFGVVPTRKLAFQLVNGGHALLLDDFDLEAGVLASIGRECIGLPVTDVVTVSSRVPHAGSAGDLVVVEDELQSRDGPPLASSVLDLFEFGYMAVGPGIHRFLRGEDVGDVSRSVLAPNSPRLMVMRVGHVRHDSNVLFLKV